MIYLLDTNAVSDLMKLDAAMTGWLASTDETDRIAICSITRGEILFGLERLAPGRRRMELAEKAAQLFSGLVCEPVPESAGDRYAVLKSDQQRRGLSLDENDLWIAATALAIGATLVSRDTDFDGIEGLSVLSPTLRPG